MNTTTSTHATPPIAPAAVPTVQSAPSTSATSTASAKPKKAKPIQFYREEAYAIQGSKIVGNAAATTNNKYKNGLRAILGEMLREPEYCTHLQHKTQPAVHLYGFTPQQLVARVKFLDERRVFEREYYHVEGTRHSRKLRINSPQALVGVASYPHAGADINEPDVQKWIQVLLDAARARWGDDFRAAYAHVDESRIHVHLYVDQGGRWAYHDLHVGQAAARALKERGESPRDQQAALKDAMAEIQDSYWQGVAQAMGWARLSPAPKPRAGHSKALADKEVELAKREEELAESARKAKAAEAEAAERLWQASQREALLADREANLEAARDRFVTDRATFDAMRQEFERATLAAKVKLRSVAATLIEAAPFGWVKDLVAGLLAEHKWLTELTPGEKSAVVAQVQDAARRGNSRG